MLLQGLLRSQRSIWLVEAAFARPRHSSSFLAQDPARFYLLNIRDQVSYPTLSCQRCMSLRGGKEEEQDDGSNHNVSPKEKRNRDEENNAIIYSVNDIDEIERKQLQLMEEPRQDNDEYARPTSIATPKLSRWQRMDNRFFSWRRSFRRRAGDVVTAGGFLSSATTSIISSRNRGQWQRLQPTVEALRNFLKESKIDAQLSSSLSIRLLENLVILSRFQKAINHSLSVQKMAALEDVLSYNDNKRQREQESNAKSATSNTTESTTTQTLIKRSQTLLSKDMLVPSVDEALRYMKFATAAYGDAMIRAAQLDVTGQFDAPRLFSSETTLSRVSGHVGVPPSDIVLLDIDYGGSDQHLRHFVAVDHNHQEIVLSIRGTFSLAELVVDAAGFAAPFCGDGQAHAEMAKHAQAIWQAAGPTVLEFWDQHPEYALVLTGHSLGAGTACLLHLLLHDQQQYPHHKQTLFGNVNVPRGRQMQCVGFASPPVFYHPNPNPALQQALRRCVNFIHGHDMVPFLSVDSVRHFLAQLQTVDDQISQLAYTDRLRLFWGYLKTEINTEWLQELQNLPRPKALHGAPCLTIPASVNFWLTPCPTKKKELSWEDDDDIDYDPTVYYQSHRCDSNKLATAVGLLVDLNMIQDHFPPRYEHALHHFHPQAEL